MRNARCIDKPILKRAKDTRGGARQGVGRPKGSKSKTKYLQKIDAEILLEMRASIIEKLDEINDTLKKLEKQSYRPSYRRLSVKETAERMGLKPKTIYNLLSKKEFPVKCARIRGSLGFLETDVSEYLMNIGVEL